MRACLRALSCRRTSSGVSSANDANAPPRAFVLVRLRLTPSRAFSPSLMAAIGARFWPPAPGGGQGRSAVPFVLALFSPRGKTEAIGRLSADRLLFRTPFFSSAPPCFFLFCGTSRAVMSAASSSAARCIPVMSRVSTRVPYLSFSAAAFFFPPIVSFALLFRFSNSPHSNLSCSPSFYTLQPLICIFLSFPSPLSPSILFTVFCLQLLASPSPLYLLLLHFFPSFAPLLSVRYPIPAEMSSSFLLNICTAFDPTPVSLNMW